MEKQVVPKKKRRAGARSYTPLAFSFRDCSEKKTNVKNERPTLYLQIKTNVLIGKSFVPVVT